MKEIRELLKAGRRVKMELKDGAFLTVVGENPGHLVVQNGEELAEAPDDVLEKAWTGNFEPIEEVRLPFIHARERDSWPREWDERLRLALDVLNGMNSIPSERLPADPVMLVFLEPGEEQIKKGIRASAVGSEIALHDPSDPVTEFLHELSHIYWRDRLTDKERDDWKDMKPPTLSPDSDHHDCPEHLFCTAHVYMLRSGFLSPNYEDLLEGRWADAHEALRKIYARVRSEDNVRTAWKAAEDRLAPALRALNSGKGAAGSLPDLIVPGTRVASEGDRSWVRIDRGRCNGLLAPVLKGRLDTERIRTEGPRSLLVPRGRLLLKAEASGTLYVDLDGVLVDLEGAAEEHGGFSDEFWNGPASESDFWAQLGWTADGRKLWNGIRAFNPVILTSAPSDAAEKGKREWVRRNLGKNRLAEVVRGDKSSFSGPGNVLVDDMAKNADGWRDAGGTAILHVSAADTLENLRRLGYKKG